MVTDLEAVVSVGWNWHLFYFLAELYNLRIPIILLSLPGSNFFRSLFTIFVLLSRLVSVRRLFEIFIVSLLRPTGKQYLALRIRGLVRGNGGVGGCYDRLDCGCCRGALWR